MSQTRELGSIAGAATIVGGEFVASVRAIVQFRCTTCGDCHDDAKQAKKELESTAAAAGVTIAHAQEEHADDGDPIRPDPKYTFMGWNSRSIELLSFGRGQKFPVA